MKGCAPDTLVERLNAKLRNQGCALAAPGGLRLLTFVFGRLEKLIFCIMLKGWAPQNSWLGVFGHPVILLRVQPFNGVFFKGKIETM